MTNYQESYQKMSSASVVFLNSQATITATLPGFLGYFTIIQSTNAQIQTIQVQQEADKSGDTAAKSQLRTTLIAQAIEVSRRVVAYATNVNDSGLLGLVDYTESDLKKSSDQKLVSSCQVIHDTANNHLAALASYGVNAASLATLQTSINVFNTSIPQSRVGTTNSGEATKTLANLFKTLITNWEKIDTLVEIVRTSHTNFYDEYQKVRKVIATGTSSLPLKVKVTNSETGKPEAKVKLTLSSANGQLKAAATTSSKKSNVKKTAAGGGANYKSVEDGNYILTATKPGFKDASETVSIVNGELAVVELKLEKE